jgi:hypothetical protein
MCYKKRITLFESFYGFNRPQKWNRGVELPKRVSSGMEHVCYLFLLTLEHVRYLSWVINTYIRMDGWTVRTYVRMYIHTGSFVA